MRRIYIYLILSLIVLISTFVLWMPFLSRSSSWFGLKIKNPSMLYIYSHYDGPLYIVPAKTLYNPERIKDLKLNTTVPEKYFAAHLPLYPLLIRGIREVGVIGGLGAMGYLKSMIGVNLFTTIGLAIFFFFLLKKFKITKNPFLLVTVFLFLPRFLVIRSVGAPESLFILLILTSLYFFENKNYLMAGVLGGLATATKTPGLLLFVAYGITIIESWIKDKKVNLNWIWLLTIPLGLLGVFGLFGMQYKDFFAYFHSGDNIHLVFPYSVFNFQKPWVGTAWLEDVLFYFFLYGLTVISLKSFKYRSFFYFALTFFIATVFIQHRDIARYSLPLWPMALIAFEKFFTSKKFLVVFLILLPAIYFYAWNFSVYNIMPIADWSPFL